MTKIKTQVLTFIAAAIALNYLGANIALFLKLPLYLDMIGTLLIALLFGPWLGAVTAIVSALLSWMTTDIFALFYAPVAIITALTAGVFMRQNSKAKDLIWKALCISFMAHWWPLSLRLFSLKGSPQVAPVSWCRCYMDWDLT